MKFRALFLLALAIIIFACAQCFAQKTAVDPNTVQTVKPDNQDAIDTRLSQKVTYEAWHIPLKTILSELSEVTGVKLNAGYNKDDWQVRDRKMNIYVKDITLNELMNSIARTMKFIWSKNKDVNPPTYRLYADRQLLAKMQAEASRLANELKNEELKRRTGTLDALASVANLSDADLEALRNDNPYLYQCASTGFANAMTQVFEEAPDIKEAFINGNMTTSVSMSMFSQSTQLLVANAARKSWKLDNITQSRAPIGDNLESDISNGTLHLDWMASPSLYTQGKKLFYFGPIGVSAAGDYHFLSDFRDPYSKTSKAWGEACLNAMDNNLPAGKNWSQIAPDYFPVEEEQTKEVEPYLMYDPVMEHTDDPTLPKEVTLKPNEDSSKKLYENIQSSSYQTIARLIYEYTLKTIADSTKMNVVSDSYNSALLSRMNWQDKGELTAILSRFAEGFKCNWENHGSILEFRRRDWFRMRASQLPDEWLKPWRDEIEKNGILTLDTYTRIVALTEEQLEENIDVDPLLNQVIGDPRTVKQLCCFYVKLNDYQRRCIISGLGLDLQSLNPLQWQYYSDIFNYGYQKRWHTEEFTNPGKATIVMKGVNESKDDGSLTYKFGVYLAREDGSTDQQEWQINLRKISVPNKNLPANSKQPK